MMIKICNTQRFIKTHLIAFQFFAFNQETLGQCTYFDLILRLLYDPIGHDPLCTSYVQL